MIVTMETNGRKVTMETERRIVTSYHGNRMME